MSDSAPGRQQPWLSSIRIRILAAVVALLLMTSLGSVLLLRAFLFDRLDDEVSLDLDQEAEEFGLLSNGNDPDTGEPFDGDLRAIFDTYFDREIPDEGESLLAFVNGRLYESRRAQDAATVRQLEPVISYWLSLEETERGSVGSVLGEARYVAIPLHGRGDDGLFVVANFPAFERDEIDSAIRTQIVVQLATAAVATLLGAVLAGRVLRPLRSLARTARRISETDLTQRIPITGRDEASQIGDAFNDMLARLDVAFSTQRRFLDDASHELRTPLTVIRGHLELIDVDTHADSRQATIELVIDEVDRMGKIVNDLFLLASAEHPDFVRLEPLDLAHIVHEVHTKATALAARDWQVVATDRIVTLADRHRITQALLQLADNAIKATSDGQAIKIGVRRTGSDATLWVQDTGHGVSHDDAERIFERFNRGRSTGRNTAGAGLGLSIVAKIAEAHGGVVALGRTTEPGACFEITIPAPAGQSESEESARVR